MTAHKLPQTYVRLTPELKEKLQEIAKKEGWNLNQTIQEGLKAYVKNYE